nr:aminoglycoside phosphotransferase family protein [Pseudonocardia oroxyli]
MRRRSRVIGRSRGRGRRSCRRLCGPAADSRSGGRPPARAPGLRRVQPNSVVGPAAVCQCGGVVASGGHRLCWVDLPAVVRRGVGELLGAAVTHAWSQAGGFSPGSADRVRTAKGGRAFVKAVSAEQNPDTPAMHRAEARICAQLPEGLPVPRLLGVLEVDCWVVLVQEDVDGRPPCLPWQGDDLHTVLGALTTLAATPCPVVDVPDAGAALDHDLRGADRLAADGSNVESLDTLCALSERARHVLARDGARTLVHTDLRADNILITERGAVFVDWPWACAGPVWLDTLLLLIEVERHGGHDVDALLSSLPTTGGIDPADLTAVLAGFVGYFLDAARRPSPPGLPRLRRFQREQGEALLGWVQHRISRSDHRTVGRR